MAVAMIYPEPEKGGRGQKAVIFNYGFTRNIIKEARLVLRVLPELAAQVPLAEAL
jgi:hypothetical protein